MTQNFTKGVLTMLAVFMLSLASCDKKKDEVIPDLPGTPPVEEETPDEPETPPVETEITCRVVALAFEEDAPAMIEYNEKGYISKATYSYERDGEVTTEFVTYSYDSADQLEKMESTVKGAVFQYTLYEHKDGLLVTAKDYNEKGALWQTTTYKYDDKKRVIEKNETYSESSVYTTKYTYDANDNVVKEEDFVNGVPDGYNIYSDHDDKPTPESAVKGLPIPDEGGLSKNNPGKRVVYYDHDSDEATEEQVSSVQTYVYEYDSKGYPTKITRLFDDGDKYSNTYTYECK